MSNVDRAKHGPSWTEVILGAVLSLVLGVAVGAVLLVLKPVVTVKEPPKEPEAGTIYFVQGARADSVTAKQALAKRKAFAAGQSVSATEQEINTLVAVPPAPKAGDKNAPAPSAETISTGTPNVRIRDGVLQVGVPVTVNVFGVSQQLVAQARGGFEKHGDVFAFEPTEMYLGSCPVQRLPFVAGYVRQKVLESQKVPDDIAAAWPKLTNVTIEGGTLNLLTQ